jgi:hypothetical protein
VLSAPWEASFAHVRALSDDGTVPDGVEETERLIRRCLAGREPLFDTRIREWRVVEDHGDLFTEDVFCLDDGPRVLDCLQFDGHLRFPATPLRRLPRVRPGQGLSDPGKPGLARRAGGSTPTDHDHPAPPACLRKELAGIPAK